MSLLGTIDKVSGLNASRANVSRKYGAIYETVIFTAIHVAYRKIVNVRVADGTFLRYLAI